MLVCGGSYCTFDVGKSMVIVALHHSYWLWFPPLFAADLGMFGWSPARNTSINILP